MNTDVSLEAQTTRANSEEARDQLLGLSAVAELVGALAVHKEGLSLITLLPVAVGQFGVAMVAAREYTVNRKA